MPGFRSCFLPSAAMLLSIWAGARAYAQDESEADLKGVYAPLDLRKHEPNDLIDTSEQYQDLFQRRSLLYNEPGVLDLVRSVGNELAPASTDPYIHYEFYVIRDPSPNAFALPNGHIYIHTGMLARLHDSSELAAVLAHEINHVAGHHAILNYRITAKRLVIDVMGGGLGSLMGHLRYTRQLEQEADDRAALVMRDTPYDPHALTDLLEILHEDFEGIDPRFASIWMTHPDPEQRIEASRQNLAGLPSKPRDPGEYDLVIYPLRALTVQDYIQDDYPYTAIAVADEFLLRYPNGLDFRMAIADAERVLGPRPPALPEDFSRRDARRNLYGRIRNSRDQRADKLLATPEGVAAQAENLERARASYEAILETDPQYVAAYRGLGAVYEAEGKDRDAARAYLTYVQQSPDAADRPVIIARLVALRDRLQKEETDNE